MDNQIEKILDNVAYPSSMVDEIAQGVEEPADIAYRYGYLRSEYDRLAKNKMFIADVATKRAEYERGGQKLKLKAKLMAEHLLDNLFIDSMGGTIGQKQESMKILMKLADLEPKQSQVQQSAGAGFSISINIPATGIVQTQTIELNAAPILDIPTFESLEDKPDEESV
jgi:hypothetical protein